MIYPLTPDGARSYAQTFRSAIFDGDLCTHIDRGTTADLLEALAAEVDACGLLRGREAKVAERETVVAAREVEAAQREVDYSDLYRKAQSERRALEVETTSAARALAATMLDEALRTRSVAEASAVVEAPEPGTLADLEARVVRIERDLGRAIEDIADLENGV